ncbi:MAG TPA: nuclear transport factor 2 family protein [Terriglobales bacterium]
MKRVAISLLLLSCVIPAFTQKNAHAGDESQIIALEHSWNQAELQHASSALDLFLSDDFIITQPDGSLMNKEQFKTSVADKTYHYDVLTSGDFKVRIFGDTALVTGSYHEKGKDKRVPFDRWGRFTDTWLFEKGKWLCVASHDSYPVQ